MRDSNTLNLAIAVQRKGHGIAVAPYSNYILNLATDARRDHHRGVVRARVRDDAAVRRDRRGLPDLRDLRSADDDLHDALPPACLRD